MFTFKRRKPISTTLKILNHLRRVGKHGAYNYELANICLSWHRRITDLRKKGFIIKRIRITQGVSKYYLVKPPEGSER